MLRSPSLFVIAAPSGAGKTTLVNALVKRKKNIKLAISFTTRKKRSTEKNGRDYIFISKKEFNDLEKKSDFLESALVFDNYYATSKKQVNTYLSNKYHVILEIDWQGAQQIRKSMPSCITIFILPPSLNSLKQRLIKRQTDSNVTIERRLRDSYSDMKHWIEFDHVVINEDLNKCVDELENIILNRDTPTWHNNKKLQEYIKNILV